MSGTDPADINMHQWYKCPPPTSANAFQIWKECGLNEYAISGHIFLVLDEWMRNNTNCKLTLQGTTYYVDWCSPTGIRIYSNAITFAKWLLCACTPCDPPVSIDSVSLDPPHILSELIIEKPETISELAELLEDESPISAFGEPPDVDLGEPELIHESTLNDFLMGVTQ